MIVWNDSFATGIPAVDEQHKELIRKFNQLIGAITQGSGRKVTGEILAFLQDYAAWHFANEERYMEQCGCPVAEVNLKAHRFFNARFNQIYERYQTSDTDPELIMETIDELAMWFINHIMTIDVQLYEYVKDEQLSDD